MNAELNTTDLSSSFIVPSSSLLQNLAGLHRPEDEVEFVEVYANVAGEVAQALLGGEVAGAGRGRLRRVDDAGLGQAAQDVLVKDRGAAEADVAREVARLFIPYPLDAAPPREPVAPLDRV